MNYFVLVAMIVFVFVGGASANAMRHPFNRPQIFRHGLGSSVFGLCNFVIMVSIFSLLIWAFVAFSWYVAIGVILGGFAIAALVAPYLLNSILGGALGLIISAVALIFLNVYAWFF